MTLIELIFFLVNLGIVVSACMVGAHWYGPVGAIVGGIGAIAALVAFYGTVFGVAACLDRCFPRRPKCRNGRCGLGDYKWLPREDGFSAYRCKCGCWYIMNGRRFLELLPDGTTKPFMRRTVFGCWKRDDARES
jgi:hypothetical protein